MGIIPTQYNTATRYNANRKEEREDCRVKKYRNMPTIGLALKVKSSTTKRRTNMSR